MSKKATPGLMREILTAMDNHDNFWCRSCEVYVRKGQLWDSWSYCITDFNLRCTHAEWSKGELGSETAIYLINQLAKPAVGNISFVTEVVSQQSVKGKVDLVHKAIDLKLWRVLSAMLEKNADLSRVHNGKTAVERILDMASTIPVEWPVSPLVVALCGEQLNQPITPNAEALQNILLYSLRANQAELVRKALRLGASPKASNYANDSALHLAATYCPEVVPDLLGLGADYNPLNAKGYTPIHLAASRGQWAAVSQIIDRAAGEPCGDEKGGALLHAVNSGQDEIAFALLNHSSPSAMLGSTYNTTLILAAQKEKYDLMLAILAKKPNVSFRNRARVTAIEILAANKNWEPLQRFISTCIEYGMGSGDTKQTVLIHVASDQVDEGQYGRWDLFWPLLQCDDFIGWKKLVDDGRRNITNRALENLKEMTDKQRQLYLAAGIGQWDLVNELVDAGVELDKEVAAFIADKSIKAQQWPLVKKLLEKNFPVSVEGIKMLAKTSDPDLLRVVIDNEGYGDPDVLNTAAATAVEISSWDLVVRAQQKGAELVDSDGALLFAVVKAGQQELANALLENGSSVSYKDADGATVLHQAAKQGWIEFCEELIARDDVDVSASNPASLNCMLHYVVMRAEESDEWKRLISLFIARGFTVLEKNIAGLTPIQLAAEESKQWLVDFMIQCCVENEIAVDRNEENTRLASDDLPNQLILRLKEMMGAGSKEWAKMGAIATFVIDHPPRLVAAINAAYQLLGELLKKLPPEKIRVLGDPIIVKVYGTFGSLSSAAKKEVLDAVADSDIRIQFSWLQQVAKDSVGFEEVRQWLADPDQSQLKLLILYAARHEEKAVFDLLRPCLVENDSFAFLCDVCFRLVKEIIPDYQPSNHQPVRNKEAKRMISGLLEQKILTLLEVMVEGGAEQAKSIFEAFLQDPKVKPLLSDARVGEKSRLNEIFTQLEELFGIDGKTSGAISAVSHNTVLTSSWDKALQMKRKKLLIVIEMLQSAVSKYTLSQKPDQQEKAAVCSELLECVQSVYEAMAKPNSYRPEENGLKNKIQELKNRISPKGDKQGGLWVRVRAGVFTHDVRDILDRIISNKFFWMSDNPHLKSVEMQSKMAGGGGRS